MPSNAEKLCDEIVRPVLICKPTTTEQLKDRLYRSTKKLDQKPYKSLSVDKKRTVSKVLPRNAPNSQSNQYKSKERVCKKNFIDVLTNTEATGPSQSDNNCLTLLRKRSHNLDCGFTNNCTSTSLSTQKSIKDTFTKEVQAFASRIFTVDKGVAHCIETASCGVQVLGVLNNRGSFVSRFNKNILISSHGLRPPKYNKKIAGSSLTTRNNTESINKQEIQPYGKTFHKESGQASSAWLKMSDYNDVSKNCTCMSIGNAKRWALTRYPTRGPDF